MINQLTFTRFLAAFAIVIFHYGTTFFPFSSDSVHFITSQANYGVSYFFVLSGFIMIVAYCNSDRVNNAEYLKNRFARIYPLVVLSVLPYFLIALKSDRVTFADVLLNLTTLQSWIPGKATAGNYPLWSITIEVFFYLCFPFLFNKFYKKYSFGAIAAVVVAVLALQISVQHYFLYTNVLGSFKETEAGHDLIYYFPLMHLGQFMAGSLGGLFYLKHHGEKRNYDLPVILCVALLLVLLKFPVLDYHNGVLALVFVPLIYFLAANTGFITKLFSNKALVFLGEISFGVYVLQAPVFSLVKLVSQKALKLPGEDLVTFWISIVVLMVASAFAHIYVEKPMRNRIKSWLIK